MGLIVWVVYRDHGKLVNRKFENEYVAPLAEAVAQFVSSLLLSGVIKIEITHEIEDYQADLEVPITYELKKND